MAISPAPTRSAIFNADYTNLGEYVTDDSRVPYFNPVDSDSMIEPGELVLIAWAGAEQVMLAQAAIFPGETGMLLRYFVVDLPCTLSADVIIGDILTWDYTDGELALDADVTNGYTAGIAIWNFDPVHQPAPALGVDSNDRAICGTTASTKVRIMGSPGVSTTKGTITGLPL